MYTIEKNYNGNLTLINDDSGDTKKLTPEEMKIVYEKYPDLKDKKTIRLFIDKDNFKMDQSYMDKEE